MEIVQEMNVRSRNMGGERTELFHKVDCCFCKKCGKQYENLEVNGFSCPECGRSEFIKGEFASALGGYLKLDRDGLLKKYYETRHRKPSIIRMNNRRILISLLIKDGLMIPGDKKTEDIVRFIARQNNGI